MVSMLPCSREGCPVCCVIVAVLICFDTVPLLQTIGTPIVASYKPMSYIDAVVQFGNQAQVRVPSDCQSRQMLCVQLVPESIS
jgi:hypothetical protein